MSVKKVTMYITQVVSCIVVMRCNDFVFSATVYIYSVAVCLGFPPEY